jgi:hypothetical protein
MHLHRHRLFPFLAGLLLAALATLPLAAQGAWSPHFDLPGFGIGGRVFTLGTWRNELVAGNYQQPWRDGARLRHIGHFDGVRWMPFGNGVDDHVRTAIEWNGDLYAGGAFSAAGGIAANHVARWNGSQWSPVGAGFDGEVWSLCVHQGQLYAGGQFDTSGSQPTRGIARWNGSQWVAVGGGVQWQLGMYQCVRTMLSDGADLFVAGDFDRAGTVPASYVARWDGAQWHALGGGINNFGWAMLWSLAKYQNRIYVGGAFGQAGSVLSENIAAWDGTQWHAVGAGLQGTSYGSVVNDLCVHGGDLFVGGHFTHSGSVTDLYSIARWDGAQFHSLGGVAIAEVNPPSVFALESWNGRLYAGGEFQVAGDPLTPPNLRGVYHIASWDGASWARVGDGLGIGNEVHTLGMYQGQAIAGGHFTVAGGNYTTSLARFDGDDWVLFGEFDGDVEDMCEHNGELWVAGEFFMVNGQVANGVARWDGTQWHTVGGGPGLHRANSIASYQGMIHVGTTGSPKRWNGSQWLTFTPPITGVITAMHVHNGVLYMGGSTPFHPGAPNLFAWDGTSLTVPGGGLNGAVEALGSHAGELIVGGRFTQAGGVPARTIARWNGASWSTFGIGIQGATVMAITTFQGLLTIGGDFSTFQGAPANYVAKWTGSAWAPIVPGAEPDGAIFALLADDARGELHAGGWYGHIGTQDAGYLGVYQVAPFWTDVGAPLATPRRAPRLSGDGRLLPGSRARWRLSSAAENSIAVFAFGFGAANVPLFGGTLVPSPDVLVAQLTDGIGTSTVQLTWPGPLPGYQLWTQAWTLDIAAPQGFSATNGVRLRAP